jgi:hypothetical protein
MPAECSDGENAGIDNILQIQGTAPWKICKWGIDLQRKFAQ